MFNVVRPVSYLPGAGYFWKYRVPMKELPQLLLSRTDVPKTGSGILLCAGVCPAAELGSWAICLLSLSHLLASELPSQDCETYRRAFETPV